MTRTLRTLRVALLAAVLILVFARPPAAAYIGPGPGFALAGSAFAVMAAIFSAILMLFTWPVRWAIRSIRGGLALARSRVTRFVILGLDGMDYRLTQKFLAEGKLPNLAALRKRGYFKPLASTVPPISPVAWSSFQTGVNPGKHNIFDFLTPDLRTYQPKLSSTEIRPPGGPSVWANTGCRWERRGSACCHEHALLDPAGQTRHLRQRVAHADHLPAGKTPRRAVGQHIRPRSAGLERNVLLLRRAAQHGCRANRRRDPPGRAKTAGSRPRWSGPRIPCAATAPR